MKHLLQPAEGVRVAALSGEVHGPEAVDVVSVQRGSLKSIPLPSSKTIGNWGYHRGGAEVCLGSSLRIARNAVGAVNITLTRYSAITRQKAPV